MDDKALTSNSSTSGKAVGNTPYLDTTGNPMMLPTTIPDLRQPKPAQQVPANQPGAQTPLNAPVSGAAPVSATLPSPKSYSPTPPSLTPPSQTPPSQTTGSNPLDRPPEDQMSDLEWFQKGGELCDPLLEDIDRSLAPLETIYSQMAGIVNKELAQRASIDGLQDNIRECDLLLRYSRQMERWLKMYHNLRVNSDKIDPMRHHLGGRPRRE